MFLTQEEAGEARGCSGAVDGVGDRGSGSGPRCGPSSALASQVPLAASSLEAFLSCSYSGSRAWIRSSVYKLLALC